MPAAPAAMIWRCRPWPPWPRLRRAIRTVAAELDRSQQFDRVVMSALHDVPVPGDLLERLLAQATASRQLTAGQHRAAGSEGVREPAAAVSRSTDRTRRSRRWILATAGVAAVAASLAVGLGLFLPRPARDVSQSQLADAAADWHEKADPRSSDWQNYAARSPHTALRVRPSRQRSIETEYGTATAYELVSGGRRAHLFAVKTRDHFAVASLPFSVVRGATGGLEIAAWQSGDLLYVLVFDKDGLQIEDFLRTRDAA